MKGYAPAEIIGEHFSRFYTEADRERAHPQEELEIATREGRFEEEGWRVRKDGRTFWANVVITALFDPEGDLIGFGKVTRDLTSRRREEELSHRLNEELARSNDELQQFASAAAHDLQEPLRTVRALAGLLERRFAEELAPEGRETVAHMMGGLSRLEELVEALLTYARVGKGELAREPIDLALVLSRISNALSAAVVERKAHVRVELGDVLTAEGDSSLIELVLQNLLANALKFADPERPSIKVAAIREGREVRIEVSDNGIGIAPDDQERIFEPFHRLHADGEYGGTGIGLAICQRIIDRHGGRIGVESSGAGGSSFWFTLPAG